MLRIGCTGAIGSGKSTVTAMLAARGVRVIDADVLARRAIEPGSAGLKEVVARFGAAVLAGGSLDRAALAEIVFNDERARLDLEAIVHPLVETAILDAIVSAPDESIVVLDIALLVETNGRSRYALDGVLVVDAPEEICIERLVEHRSMTEAQARARLAAQTPRAERLRAADFIIMNLGTLDELNAMVDEAWSWISRLGEEQAAGR